MLPAVVMSFLARLPGQPRTHLQAFFLSAICIIAMPHQTGLHLLDGLSTLLVFLLLALAWCGWRWQSQQEIVDLAQFLIARTACAGLQAGLVAYALMVWLDYLARGLVPDDLNAPLAVILPLFSYQCWHNLKLIWPRLAQFHSWQQRQRLQLSRLQA
jgi:hypothetical protein